MVLKVLLLVGQKLELLNTYTNPKNYQILNVPLMIFVFTRTFTTNTQDMSGSVLRATPFFLGSFVLIQQIILNNRGGGYGILSHNCKQLSESIGVTNECLFQRHQLQLSIFGVLFFPSIRIKKMRILTNIYLITQTFKSSIPWHQNLSSIIVGKLLPCMCSAL